MKGFMRSIRSALALKCGKEAYGDGGPPLEEQARLAGVTDERVLAAMARVPREEFMPEELRGRARVDNAFPIGEGQTISQPTLVAKMTQSLGVRSSDNVLEVGAGSGYQAAILSLLAATVHAVEIRPSLARDAAARLSRLGFGNVTIHHGDGFTGWQKAAPYDAIVVSCAVPEIPEPLVSQLRDGGRMILPLGSPPAGQRLTLVSKGRNGRLEKQGLLHVQFVPLTGPHGAGS